MTAHPLTRIVCDRCGEATEQAIANVPVQSRAAGPKDWKTMTLGTDPSTPPTHLCPSCADGFERFMLQPRSIE